MDWSFGDVLWTLFIIYFWVMFIWIFVGVFADLFRRDDLSGGGKAAWIVVIVLLPFLGTLIYICLRPSGSMVDVRRMNGADNPRLPIH